MSWPRGRIWRSIDPRNTRRWPRDIIEEICHWIGPCAAGTIPPRVIPEALSNATIGWGRGVVQEEVVQLGHRGLVGILHPARGWFSGHRGVAEFRDRNTTSARAGRGWSTAGSWRFPASPRSAWTSLAGERALTGHAPGWLYDQHGVGEVGEAVAALRDLGHSRIVLAGLVRVPGSCSVPP